MAGETAVAGYRTYWTIWGVLLVLTVAMIFLDGASLPRAPLVILLIAAMLVKAILVAGWFMHLRFETPSLRVSIFLGLLVMGAILFLLLIPDGLRIFGMTARG